MTDALTATTTSEPIEASNEEQVADFSVCKVCARIEHEMYDYLCRFQYTVFHDRDVQLRLAEQGRLCSFHTWRYDALANRLGICNGFKGVLGQLATRLRDSVNSQDPEQLSKRLEKLRPTSESCDLCDVERKIEQAAVTDAAQDIIGSAAGDSIHHAGFCIPHLLQIAKRIPDQEMLQKVITLEANLIERLSEDMHRYTLTDDNDNRLYTGKKEDSAARRALALLAGRKNIRS